MDRARVEDVDDWIGPADVKRPLGRALGLEGAALNYYELAPGDSFAFGYHRHDGQEEVFYVVSGTATFETEEGEVTVDAGEAVRFAPGEYQRGWNRGDERVVALAFGAPRESGETEVLVACPDCGERTPGDVRRAGDGDALVTVCERCGAETARYE
jgi:uncharacterized cupin superfamily protein